MKKILSVGISALLLLSGTNAFADETPKLLYNYAEIGETGSMPFISDGRTMLPFRYLLQSIGAVVGFNDDTRTVRAKKGDTRISFSLDDNYLYVQKGDAVKRIRQDVPNIVKDDRVYVPIRFMAEAFGMKVGWDSERNSAIIVDIPQYIGDFASNSYSLKRYLEINNSLKKKYEKTESTEFSYSYKSHEKDKSNTFSLNTDVIVSGTLAQADFKLSIASDYLKDKLLLDIPSLDNLCGTAILNGNQLHIKSNLGEVLKKYETDDKNVITLADDAKSDTWYSANFCDAFDSLGLSKTAADFVTADIFGSITEKNVAEIIAASVENYDTQTVEDAYVIDSVFKIYKRLFAETFLITDKGDSTYSIKMFFPSIDIVKLAKEIYPDIEKSNDAMEDLKQITFDIDGEETVDYNTYGNSKFQGRLSVDREDYKINSDFSNKFRIVPDTKKEIQIPQQSENLISLLGNYRNS